jgi:hypothetical protein
VKESDSIFDVVDDCLSLVVDIYRWEILRLDIVKIT